MNIKYTNVFFSIFILLTSSIANAGLLSVGDIVSDAFGENWVYVGEYDIASGPIYDDANGDGTYGDYAPIYTGITAAIANFGVLASHESYALSSIDGIVNHLAWYDVFDDSFREFDEDYKLDIGDDGLYSQTADLDLDGNGTFFKEGDASAWILDHAEFIDSPINYVFKSVNVSEPSTMAIFSLALLTLVRRSFKK